MAEGKVFLVGAGPGDCGLLTLNAVRALAAADVVVYDRLINDQILSFAAQAAELIYVGKQAACHTLPQPEINDLLISRAAAGKCVVRLKGGDPFVFGRGGEEAAALAAAGVSFEIVPGVTAAVAAPAYAGIPVTQRGLAASFAVVTGHEDPARPDSMLAWEHLSTGVDTLIFVMGIKNIAAITAELLAHGRKPDTPAAFIERGTRPAQRVVVTTLAAAAAEAEACGIRPPAVFVVGAVVALREQLRWFDTRPLSGRRILVTRMREQAQRQIDILEAWGAECYALPAIRLTAPDDYAPLDAAIASLEQYRWVVFTSANGVASFFQRLEAAGGDSRRLGQVKLAAIGPGTAAALRKHGIKADVIPLEFRAEGIVAAMKGRIAPGDRVLLPRAQKVRTVLADGLRALGAVVDDAAAYAVTAATTVGKLPMVDYVTFTSASAVQSFIAITGDEGCRLLQTARLACIGPLTAAACLTAGFTPAVIAGTYTLQGLAAAIVDEEAKMNDDIETKTTEAISRDTPAGV